MRKVKVLAFVLAALMVVAAFAGCGTKQLKTDVSALDERVTALETLLKQVSETVNGGATKDDITEILDAITANKAEAAAGDKTLADAIAKITADQATANAALKADLEKLVDAAKKDQAAGDAALQVAIEKLNNSIDATNKALADAIKDLEGDITAGDKATLDAVKELLNEQNKDIADALAKIEETIAKNQEAAGANADLQAAINTYVGNLTVLKSTYDADKEHYVATDFVAVSNAIALGMQNINAATTVELAKTAYDAAIATLAKYERVDTALYNAIKALENKVDDKSKDAIEDLEEQLADAKEHYDEVGNDTALTKYLGNKKINLETDVKLASDAYDAVEGILAKIKALNTEVDKIDAVRLYDVKNLNDKGEVKTYASNAEAIAKNKEALTALEKEIQATAADKTGRFLSDALLNKVTKRAAITEQAELIADLYVAKAQLSTYGDIKSGTFAKVFANYNETASDVNWFNQVDVYADIDEKVAEWLEDYPCVDAVNAEGIINEVEGDDLDFYDNYVANRGLMNLFAAAYDKFVADFVPEIEELCAMKKVTTANVQAWGDLYNAIEAWKVVVPENEKTEAIEKVVISDAQYAEMCEEALDRKTDFVFAEKEVATFFETTISNAKLVAADLKASVKALEDADKKAHHLDVKNFKKLEGYTSDKNDEDDPDAVWSLAKDKFVEADLVDGGKLVLAAGKYTFEMFEDVYEKVKTGKYDYDLSFLIAETEAKYDALLAKVEARINEAKAITVDVNAKYDAIMKNVKDVAKVSLKYEADVNALEADYAALTNLGFKPASTKTWEEVKKSDGTGTGTYTNKVLVKTDTYLKVTFLINYVNKLRAMSDAIVDYTEAIVAMNAASGNAVTVKNASTKVPVYKTSTDKCKDGKNDDSHNHGIDADFDTLAFSFKDVKDGGNKWSTVIEDAYKAYNQFMVDNNKDNDKKSNKDVALEDAMKTLEDLKFIVIKNKAYVAISNVTESSTGFTWRNTNSDFATQKALSLAAIEMAADLETVAYILEGFNEMTSVSYTAIEFAGATIFNTDGALNK